ncbi:MAG: cyclic nucleotide-binding domain-containing protein, partial [bacterium]
TSQTLNRAWDVLITLSATLAALFIPIKLVLGWQNRAGMIYFDVIGTAVFSIDLFLQLQRSRYAKQDQFIHEKSRSAAGYQNGWLTIDLLAAMPLNLVFHITLLQFLRLLKLARIAQFMRHWRQRAVKYSNLLRLTFFAYWLLLSAHWLACGWLALRGVSAADDDWTNYLRALYWTIQTLSTVGYGDLTPVTNAQTLYTMGVMIVGVGVYGYIIGNVASLLANIDPAKAQHLANMERLTAFMNYRNIPPRLQKRLRDYYAYLWEKRMSFDESNIISALPPSLRTEVALFLKRDIIEKVPLFQGASDEFIREIALQMTPVIFTPGDYVYKAGEWGRDMYFITQGAVEVVSKDGTVVYATLTDGDFFGEIALVLQQHRSASVRAVSYCDLYRLDKEMFDHVLAHYPNIAAQIEAKARERNKEW